MTKNSDRDKTPEPSDRIPSEPESVRPQAGLRAPRLRRNRRIDGGSRRNDRLRSPAQWSAASRAKG
jgi:hypothetical protein